MTARLSRRSILIGATGLIFLDASVANATWLRRRPADLDLSREKPSEAGLYAVAIAPAGEAPSVGPLHAWIVTIGDAASRPVDDAQLRIDGGMPQHGHGLPTAPAVTQRLGAGRYLVEGVRFNMPGWWEFTVAIAAGAGADSVTFNLVL